MDGMVSYPYALDGTPSTELTGKAILCGCHPELGPRVSVMIAEIDGIRES